MSGRHGDETALGRWCARSQKTYAWLAKAIGVSRTTAVSWAVGRTCPSPAHAKALARLTGLSLDDLLVATKGAPAPQKRGAMWGTWVGGNTWRKQGVMR